MTFLSTAGVVCVARGGSVAGLADVPPGHPGRADALLDEAGLIHHQHPARLEPLDPEGAQLIAHHVGVPVRRGHGVRASDRRPN
jgi:hypothetical protein